MTNKKEKADVLEQIKRLLILDLIQKGVQGKEIARALGVDPAIISRTVPTRKIKRKK